MDSTETDSLKKFLEEYKTNNSTGSDSWVGALISGILVLIVVAVLGFIAWRRGKELAKLKHEQAVREEEAHQAEVDANLSSNDQKQHEAQSKIDAAQKRIEEINQERKKVEEDRNEVLSRIDSITSWDDVDRFLGR